MNDTRGDKILVKPNTRFFQQGHPPYDKVCKECGNGLTLIGRGGPRSIYVCLRLRGGCGREVQADTIASGEKI